MRKIKISKTKKWRMNMLLKIADRIINFEYFNDGKKFGFRRTGPPFKLYE